MIATQFGEGPVRAPAAQPKPPLSAAGTRRLQDVWLAALPDDVAWDILGPPLDERRTQPTPPPESLPRTAAREPAVTGWPRAARGQWA